MKALLSAAALLGALACASPSDGSHGTVEIGAAPSVDGDATYYVYVTAESSDEVYVIAFDGEAARIEDKIEVGYQPTEIEGPHGLTVSPDGSHWFVTMAHGKPYGFLYKYVAGSNELVGKVELGLFPATMQISEASGLLYCVNFDLHGDMSPSTVSIVDPEEMIEVGRTTTGPMPHGSRVSPDGRSVYSCSMMSGTLYEMNAFTFAIERTLDLGGMGSMGAMKAEGAMADMPAEDAERGMARPSGMTDMAGMAPSGKAPKPTWVYPHPSKSVVYVALNGADEVVEVDLDRWEIVRRFETEAGPYNVEVTPDGSRMVVSYKSAGAIGVWDPELGVELAKLPSSRRVTHGVVTSPDSRYAFVSSEGIGSEAGTVDVVDLESNEIVGTVEIGLQAGGIAFWKMVGGAGPGS